MDTDVYVYVGGSWRGGGFGLYSVFLGVVLV